MPPDVVMKTLARLWPLLGSVPTAVAGGIALSYWGNPRSTQDIDLAIVIDNLGPLNDTLTNAGFVTSDKPPVELGLFSLHRWEFADHASFVNVEVDFMMSTSEYYLQAIDRTVEVNLVGVPMPVSVLSREDLILLKLYADRLIDHADVLNLMELHWPELDLQSLERWAEQLKLTRSLQVAISRYHNETKG